MLSFDDAIKILGKNKAKRIVFHTAIQRTKFDNTVKITLYNFDIIFITKCDSDNGDIYGLYAGNHQTKCTKERLNMYGPVQIYQKDFVWYTKYGAFHDGQMFNAKGELIGGRYDCI